MKKTKLKLQKELNEYFDKKNIQNIIKKQSEINIQTCFSSQKKKNITDDGYE